MRESNVDAVLAIKDIYPLLLSHMKEAQKQLDNKVSYTLSGRIGKGWAISGGEAYGIISDHYLAADGIENVIRVLEDLEDEKILPGLQFVELNACSAGCVGGVLTVENPYIAKAKVKQSSKYEPVLRMHCADFQEEPPEIFGWTENSGKPGNPKGTSRTGLWFLRFSDLQSPGRRYCKRRRFRPQGRLYLFDAGTMEKAHREKGGKRIMTVKELTLTDNYEIVHLGDPEAVISEPYCCDLLSIAMGNAPAASAWCTVMSNMNTLAVASLTECACVILCHNVSIDENMKLKAVSENMNVLRTAKPIFTTALEVYKKLHENPDL